MQTKLFVDTDRECNMMADENAERSGLGMVVVGIGHWMFLLLMEV